MAIDKAIDSAILDENLTAVADAIRTKGGTNAALVFPGGFIDAIHAISVGTGGATDEGWVRPSDWPNYDVIDRTNMEAIFFTYSCIDAIESYASFSVSTSGSGNYLVERGYIDADGFHAISSSSVASNTVFSERLPIDEGNYIVYKVSPETDVDHLAYIDMVKPTQITDAHDIIHSLQRCVERWGRAPYMLRFGSGYGYKSWACKFLEAESIIDCVSITNLSNCWQNCHVLQSLDLSGWDVSNVTSMASCWQNCYALQSLDLSGWDVSNVTNLANCWQNCYVLRSLDLSGWDVSNVKGMGSCWSGCYTLQSLDLSGWDVSNVTSMAYCWQNCYVLQSLNLSGWDVLNVTNLANCWQNCYSLQQISMAAIYLSFSLNTSALLQASSLAAIIDALAAVTTAQTLTLHAAAKARLTDEQIALATEKGWTIA